MITFDPLDSAKRDALLAHHPLMLKTYFTLTPTIIGIYEKVRELIFLSESSVYFWSSPRMGKTECAKAIKYLLNQEFPDKLIILASCDVSQEVGVAVTIFKNLQLVKNSTRQTLGETRDRVINHIICELAGKNGGHCLLMLDEMQALTDKDYQSLQVIQNELKLNNVSLTTIGFAQKEINSVRTSLIGAAKAALVARFLSRRERFTGCVNVEWLTATLETFDESLTYPEMSSCSFTNFFLPQAVNAGFKLSSSAEMLFKVAQKSVSGSTKRIPTANLFTAIGFLLATARAEDKPEFILSHGLVSRAIDVSGMAEFANLMANSEKDSSE